MTATVSTPRPQRHLRVGHAWASVGKSAGTRLLILPISAVIGIISTRLIIDNFGMAAYAQFGLLVGIISLLPFADLGLSAVIMNTVGTSKDPRRDDELRRVLLTSIRLLLASAAVLLVASLVLTTTGLWPALLGDGLLPAVGPLAAAACLALIALGLPLGIGQRILTGLGRNHVAIAVMGLQSPVVLICVVALVWTGARAGPWLALAPYLAMLGLSGVATAFAARRISPTVGLALRDVPRLRSVRGGKVSHVAWPMLVQMIALPLAMQTDRVILSHVSATADLASYNLAAQMFTPVWAVASAAGLALWPIFARQRTQQSARPGDISSPRRMALGFILVATLAAAIIGLAAPLLASVASGGAIRLPLSLIVWFGVLIVAQCAKVPLGMSMTDARGLSFQAVWIMVMLPVNLGLSWILALQIGATGPVIGSAIGVLLCQVLPNWWYVARHPLMPG